MTCKNCKREDPYAWLLCSGCWDMLDVWTQIEVAMAYETRLVAPNKFTAWKEYALRIVSGKPFPVYAKL